MEDVIWCDGCETEKPAGMFRMKDNELCEDCVARVFEARYDAAKNFSKEGGR